MSHRLLGPHLRHNRHSPLGCRYTKTRKFLLSKEAVLENWLAYLHLVNVSFVAATALA